MIRMERCQHHIISFPNYERERIIQNKKKYNSQFNEVDNNFHFSYFISQ
jgi:hypothetical protein